MAGALRASGVEPGDRVAYLMPNLPEMLIAHFAVPLAGGILVAINTRLTAEEVSYILRHSGAKILVTDAALLPVAAAATEGTRHGGSDSGGRRCRSRIRWPGSRC